MKHSPEAIVQHFNDFINAGDLAGLSSLMTEDHTFIDSANSTLRGKERALEAWHGFFSAFPDYANVFERLTAAGNLVTAVGRSVCSLAALAGPTLWTAKVEGDKVSEWRVYEDVPENRQRLEI